MVRTKDGSLGRSALYWRKKTYKLIRQNNIRTAMSGFDQILLNEARDSCKRVAQYARSTSRRQQEMGAVAAAIMCSAAACEATLSERVSYLVGFAGANRYRSIARLIDPSDRWKCFLKMVAPNFRPGDSVEYRDLKCLFYLRNHIAHRHARFLRPNEWPKKLYVFIQMGVIPTDKKDELDWIERALTAKTGRWAYKTATKWQRLVKVLVPHRC